MQSRTKVRARFIMNNHDFITLPVADKTEMDAYIALPGEDRSYPGIILLQEAFGVNHHIRNVAERLCNEGYAVITPDLFHRTARRIEIAYTDFGSAVPHIKALTNESLKHDVQAAYMWLEEHPSVAHTKVASIGFCMGGRVSFLANSVLPLAAGISYYGGGLDGLASEAPNLHGTHLFFWGGKDTHIPQEKIDIIVNAVKAAGKDYINTVISYAGHAFNCDERPSYHPLAAKEAWAMTLTFLANRLK